MRSHRLRVIVPAIVVVMLGAGCGGGDDDAAPTTTGQTTTTSATTTTEASATTGATTTAGPATTAGTTAATTTAPPATTGDPTGTPRVIEIGADDSEGFDTDRLSMAAGETVTIVFDNRDAGGEPHNFHITTDTEELATPITVGPDKQELTFTIATPGEYQFLCDTHLTQMAGVMVVE